MDYFLFLLYHNVTSCNSSLGRVAINKCRRNKGNNMTFRLPQVRSFDRFSRQKCKRNSIFVLHWNITQTSQKKLLRNTKSRNLRNDLNLMIMFNGSEIHRVCLGALPNNAAPPYHHKKKTNPSGGHSMKQVTRTLESVMKDKERWWRCHRVKQMKEITKYTVESWNRKKTQYINGKKWWNLN